MSRVVINLKIWATIHILLRKQFTHPRTRVTCILCLQILKVRRSILIEPKTAFMQLRVIVNTKQSKSIHAMPRISVYKEGLWLFFVLRYRI